MKNPELIATTNPEARANPMIWEGEEAADGVFLGVQSDDPLALLGTPTMVPAQPPRLPDDFSPSPELRSWLAQLQCALMDAASEQKSEPLSVTHLDSLSIQAVVEILGDGEVHGTVTLDDVRYQIQESLLPGVWQCLGDDGSHTVEVAELPSVVKAAAESLKEAPFEVPKGVPGLMNAPAVLAEISDRASSWNSEALNHVVNFTLLPMSDTDQMAVRETLGRAELELESGGFGQCRVFATRYRHVWAVQFLNALNHIILDTVEVGRPPNAVTASREDFEDSAQRLAQILESYL